MPSPKLSLEPLVRTTRANALTALASSPWAPLVAVGGQKQVLLYHSDTLELLGVLPFPEGVPHVLKFSRNGRPAAGWRWPERRSPARSSSGAWRPASAIIDCR